MATAAPFLFQTQLSEAVARLPPRPDCSCARGAVGSPKPFASEVVVHAVAAGKTLAAAIKVTQPLVYRGIAVCRSSSDDGGTTPLPGAIEYTIE